MPLSGVDRQYPAAASAGESFRMSATPIARFRAAYRIPHWRRFTFEGIEDLARLQASGEFAEDGGVLEPLTGTLPKGGLHAVGRISDADDLAAAEPGGSSPRLYRNRIGAFESGPGDGSLECCGPITCSFGNFIDRQRGVFVRLIAYEIPVCSAAP